MASPAQRFPLPSPVRTISRRPPTVTGARWAFIMGQRPAFVRSGGVLYICNAEALRCLSGVAWALAIEAVAAIGVYGLWRLGRWIF